GVGGGESALFIKRCEFGEREAGHRVHELLKPLGATIKLFEHSCAAVLHLVLRLARLEGFGQVTPESIKSRIGHVEETADIGTAVPVMEMSGILRIAGIVRPLPRRLAPAHPEPRACRESRQRLADEVRVRSEAVARSAPCHSAR